MDRAHRIASLVPAVRLPRIPSRSVLGVLLAAVVLGGGWLWLRDSSLAAVTEVQVIGLSSSERDEVRTALDTAARNMTTLHVDRQALEEAVARFPSVAGLRVQADFPHGLAIEVTERMPIAAVDLGGEKVPVGSGGRIMRGVTVKRTLPVLSTGSVAGDRLEGAVALDELAILAAAPPVLRRRVTRVLVAGKGLMVDLSNGPSVYFGTVSRPIAKWMAAARVLADPSSRGAVYLDVRIPERVAAGGLGTPPADLTDPLALSAEAQTAQPQLTPESTPSLNP